jgi:cell division protein FtsQ
VRELAAALPRTLAAFPRKIAKRPVSLSLSPRARRRIVLALLVATALGSLYWFWFRDSSFVAVEKVEVTGLTSKDGPRIESALADAGERMTTLNIRLDDLEEVAAQFPVVGSIRVERDFPHGLRIAVTERRPAALVSVDGVPLPVAGDGTLLRGLQAPEGLPLVRMEKPVTEGRVTDEETLRALLVAGAAPGEFPQRIDRISEGAERGIVVELEEGPEILFGDADHAARKWAAATRVLADPEAQGATYIDVRLPERPVAGGLPVETIEPVAPAGDPVAPPAAPVDPAAPAIDPATGAPIDPATGAPIDPAAAAPTAPVEPAPAEPQAAQPDPVAPPASGTTGAVTSPQP